ncbi:hypothetical protein ACIQC9_05300 [Brevundimonas sp. NPDC092305]|uniref:hypothetical protein n=1 Tax=Brevundimonas sp. NPDC092305 TaxID=3363957 RepID=UPI0037F835B0
MMSPIYLFSQSFLVLVSAAAFWRGRGWERATAIVLLLNWLGTELGPDFNTIDPPWFGNFLDALVCLFMIYAALFSGRAWTLWAAAFQILLMANHLAFIRFHALEQWAYITAYYVWGDLLLVALLIGIIFPRRSRPPGSPPVNAGRA